MRARIIAGRVTLADVSYKYPESPRMETVGLLSSSHPFACRTFLQPPHNYQHERQQQQPNVAPLLHQRNRARTLAPLARRRSWRGRFRHPQSRTGRRPHLDPLLQPESPTQRRLCCALWHRQCCALHPLDPHAGLVGALPAHRLNIPGHRFRPSHHLAIEPGKLGTVHHDGLLHRALSGLLLCHLVHHLRPLRPQPPTRRNHPQEEGEYYPAPAASVRHRVHHLRRGHLHRPGRRWCDADQPRPFGRWREDLPDGYHPARSLLHHLPRLLLLHPRHGHLSGRPVPPSLRAHPKALLCALLCQCLDHRPVRVPYHRACAGLPRCSHHQRDLLLPPGLPPAPALHPHLGRHLALERPAPPAQRHGLLWRRPCTRTRAARAQRLRARGRAQGVCHELVPGGLRANAQAI